MTTTMARTRRNIKDPTDIAPHARPPFGTRSCCAKASVCPSPRLQSYWRRSVFLSAWSYCGATGMYGKILCTLARCDATGMYGKILFKDLFKSLDAAHPRFNRSTQTLENFISQHYMWSNLKISNNMSTGARKRDDPSAVTPTAKAAKQQNSTMNVEDDDPPAGNTVPTGQGGAAGEVPNANPFAQGGAVGGDPPPNPFAQGGAAGGTSPQEPSAQGGAAGGTSPQKPFAQGGAAGGDSPQV